MVDHATPNLPSIDLDATEEFYANLGFTRGYRSPHWMILHRATLKLEFFPWPDLDPRESNHTCCLRLDDLDAMVETCKDAGIPVGNDKGVPRIVPPRDDPAGIVIAFLVDVDGTMLRLIQNPRDAGAKL